jgi:hypothetical protein
VIKRAAVLLVLIAISGLLVYGGVHRTQSVLASQRGDGGAVQVQGSGTHGNGHGNGAGEGASRGAGGE